MRRVKPIKHSYFYARLFFSSPKPNNENFYSVLEVHPSAKSQQIKEAYYKLAKLYHPDTIKKQHKNQENLIRSYTQRFNKISHAYSILSDSQRRRQYDLTIGIRNHETFNDPYSKSCPDNQKDQNQSEQIYDRQILRRKKRAERKRNQALKEQQELRKMTNKLRIMFFTTIIGGLFWWSLRPSPRQLMRRGVPPGQNTII